MEGRCQWSSAVDDTYSKLFIVLSKTFRMSKKQYVLLGSKESFTVLMHNKYGGRSEELLSL